MGNHLQVEAFSHKTIGHHFSQVVAVERIKDKMINYSHRSDRSCSMGWSDLMLGLNTATRFEWAGIFRVPPAAHKLCTDQIKI